MTRYLIRRLLLLPITLFFIILVNFVIINLAPGEPTSSEEISATAGVKREGGSAFIFAENRWLQFREFYGLTLPLILNFWPFQTKEETLAELLEIIDNKNLTPTELSYKRRLLGDKARFQMRNLLLIIDDSNNPPNVREEAARFFRRGAFRLAVLGQNLSPDERKYNRRLEEAQLTLSLLSLNQYSEWYQEEKGFYQFEPTTRQTIALLFFETRFCRYFSRILTLDFGTLRNGGTKTVVSEVASRMKISLALSVTPMVLTFFISLFLGFLMALFQDSLLDRGLNLLLLILWSIPVYVVAPFLIDRFALHGSFPISGFSSFPAVYETLTSWGRLKDILHHLVLPFIAVIYAGFAFQTRLTRNSVLEVMHAEYVRYGYLKGLSKPYLLFFYVGKAAAIPLVTSLAGSLGVVLSGSLIVETLFEIDGFGRFFYQAVVNRDYNVVLFSQLASSFLALIGFLVADLLYIALDPRITFYKKVERA